MREGSRAIIFKDNKILLIYRKKENREYYVFPGGGIEPNESKEDCVVRELKEEVGITIKPIKELYEIKGDTFHQHIFLCEWVDGVIGTGNKEEYDVNRIGGIQIPMLIDINELKDINLVSEQIKHQLLEDITKYGLELDNVVKIINEIAKS